MKKSCPVAAFTETPHRPLRPRPLGRSIARLLPLLTCAATLAGAPFLLAAPIIKDAAGTDLSLGASWTGGVAPVSTDVATWDTGSLGTGLTFGANTSWQGIALTAGETNAVIITGANNLTLGTSGIDMSAAANNLTVGANNSTTNLTLTGLQTWNVAAGRTFSFQGNQPGGLVSGPSTLDFGGNTVTIAGSGTTNAVSLIATHLQNGIINVSSGIFDVRGGGSTNAQVDSTVAVNVASGAIYNVAYTNATGSLFNQALTLNGGTLRKSDSVANTLAFGGTIALGTGGGTISNTGGTNTWTVGSVISGSSTLTTNGLVTLSGTTNNTYSGGTTIATGTLALGTGGTGSNTSTAAALGTGTVSISSGATLKLWIQNSTTFTIANNLSLSGGTVLSQDGIYNMGGTVSLTGANTFATTYSGKDLNFTNVVSGAGSVTVQGAGTTRLTAANTYTGSTTINGSQLVISNANASSGFVLSNNATLNLRSISLSSSQNITGAGNLTKDIAFFGDSTIAGTNNNYTGSTTVNLSKFTLAAGGVINGTSSITILGQFAAQLVNNGAITTATAGSFTSSTNTGFTGTANDTGVFINNSGAALNIGTGGLSVGAPFFLNSGSTFTSAAGTMAVNSNGLVTFGDATQLNTINAAGITLNTGGSLVATGAQNTVQGWINSGKISSASAGAIALAGNSSESINFAGYNNLGLAASGNAIYSGAITTGTSGYQFGGTLATSLTVTSTLTGANALTKTGASVLTLTAANSYSGATTVNGGTLAIGGTGSISNTSSVTIGAGTLATNSLNAIGTAGSTITRNSGTAVLIYGGAGETTDRVLNDTAGSTFTNNGRGTLTLTSNVTVPNSAVVVTFNGGGNTSIQGVTGNTGTTLLTFNKAGVGTLTVNGNINPGTGGAIRTQGGVLAFSSTATTTSDAIFVSPRVIGGVLQVASGSSIKTADANTNGILGGWATFNNTDWAVTNTTGVAIGALAPAGYTANTWTANTTNVDVTSSNTSSGLLANSLRFNTTGALTQTLSGVNLLTSGGILVTSAVGANTTTITGGTSLSAGALNATTDLIIHQFNNSGGLTIASPIVNNGTGTTSLTKDGAGTLTFSTQKTYTGNTNVLAGILDLTGGGGSNGVIRGTANVAAGATLRLSTLDATGYDSTTRLSTINLLGGTLNVNTTSNQTLGSAVLNLTGGAITLSSASGNIDFFGGSSALNTLASGTTSTISGVSLSALRQGSTTFTVAQGYTPSGIDLDIQSVIRTNGDPTNAVLTKAGTGTLALSGTNTIGSTGTGQSLLISAGTVMIGNGGTTGNISSTASFGVTNNATLAFNRSDTAGSFANVISGTGVVNQIGSGTTTLTGANTYTGGTSVLAGTLALGDITATPGTYGSIGAGTLSTAGQRSNSIISLGGNTGVAATLANAITLGTGFRTELNVLNGSATTGRVVTVSGLISGGAAGATRLYINTDTSNGSLGVVKLTNASNTFLGTIQLNRGGLAITSDGALGNAANSIFFDVGTTAQVGLRFDTALSSARAISLGGGKQVFDTNGNDVTLSGVISGTGELSKSGTGTLTLSNTNNYTGPTTVNAGTLSAGASGGQALGGTGSVAVNTGGTLLLGADNQIKDTATVSLGGGTFNTGGLSETVGALSLTTSSTIDFGTGASVLHFADSHSSPWTGTLSIYNWSGVNSSTDQLFFGTDSSGLSPTQLGQISFYGDSGTTFLGSGSINSVGELEAVPEPSTVTLVVGMLGLVGWRERRRFRRPSSVAN